MGGGGGLGITNNLTTGRDFDILNRLVSSVGVNTLNIVNNIHTLKDLTEDNVLAVQPGGDNSGNEELGTVGVLTGVSHGQKTWLAVLQSEVLVGKTLTIDGLTTSTVASGEVTTLDHEVRNDTVENRVQVAHLWVSGNGQLVEVLNSLWNNLTVQTHDNAANRLVAVGDVKVDLVGDNRVSSQNQCGQ